MAAFFARQPEESEVRFGSVHVSEGWIWWTSAA